MKLYKPFKELSIKIADAAAEGLDKDGGLWYEYDPAKDHIDKRKTFLAAGGSNGWFF